ncbi:MAG TPA: LysM peptidoglycan-binding domain-containing protein [Bacteroidales bacterium]|jgi:membrane-bound lytic murein transglycosylase D|nr:MAG: Membrane-bound lytic murein transglycosylase D precursor [Bacteroidetes bacterium ADurb.Bin012]HNQ59856.1 LysM peptidoglycan-binding domain-containing protein [Bacteroidales bacterium]HNU21445.1 LysM peptidoglycan-binding domain-containing protein [Bacteroidales bacterium]HNV16949.1 LysM peptidoglycan-binding domain-containing protein [Bacteroidales bacterium]HOC15503.1 LysM peptidoglycan-binding domain-containing protein [Bacteroidales bacterium]
MKGIRKILILFILLSTLEGQSQKVLVHDTIHTSDSGIFFLPYKKVFNPEVDLIEDSPILRALDSLANIKFFQDYYFTADASLTNVYQFPGDFIPVYSDSVYQQRIENMKQNSPIDYTFNCYVKDYIELYAVKKRQLTQRLLGLSYIYFPLFEGMLDKYELPLELKYLAVIESALNPIAGSRAGAKGLWQFMYGTGKVYGLKATSLVDDRFDPYLSTDAACRHLKDLYDLYEDWFLVLAAYNSGVGNVNKAIRRAGGTKNYWAIWPYLPAETRGYVPAFIAASYIMQYAPEHNLYPLHPGILYNGIDTVVVREPVSFDQISEVLGVPIEDIKFLNPSYKLGIIPVAKDQKYYLQLPREFIGDFINNEYTIYNYTTTKGIEKEKLLKQIKNIHEQQIHIVRSGESLSSIARKYHCSVSDIKKWNNLKSNTVKAGKRLIIYSGTSSIASTSSSNNNQTTDTKPEISNSSTNKEQHPNYHIVKRGETLSQISIKYNCTINELISWNNLKGYNIQVNQRLLIHPPAAKNDSASSEINKQVKYRYYTVKEGDTLWDIAQQFDGVTVDEIKKLNNLRSNRISVGQKLKIKVIN